MKYTITIIVIILLMIPGCGEQRQQDNDDFITVDLSKNYSSKKELILQDFMDVEYIALETTDDFVNQGFVQDIGKEFILVKNRNDNGDIFLYDRTGKAINKINRKGQGNEEYTNIYRLVLDESNHEIFVSDIFARKIFVYDFKGNFLRSFRHNLDDHFYTDIFNYDENHLICYDQYNEETVFVLISKKDGSITENIEIPFQKKIFLRQQKVDEAADMVYSVSPGPYRSIIPHKGNWYLSELSSDTIYRFFPDHTLRPLIVRTPSIQEMDPEIFLLIRLFSDRYYFMETIKNVYDFASESGFPKTYFMYDTQEKAFFRYNVYNGDFTYKKEIYMSTLRPVNHEIESWQSLDAHELIATNKRGQLKGKLKEIVETLDEDDNPVIMLVKHMK